MNTILLKIHNAKQTVAEAVVVTKDGTPTTVKALKRVNYELIDQATDFAPHHIVTKRVAQDLHVSFEEDGQVTDLVIEGFYDAGDTALIGLAEDGQYYYFIPDTANESDYVTQLAVGDVEGQALGGMPYTAPWWVGATEKAGFPWIGLLAGIGGIIALDDDDDKGNRGTDNGNNTNPTPPTPTPTNTTIPKPTIDTPNGSAIVTPSSSQHDCMVIEYFDEADDKQRIVVEKKVEKKGTVWEVTETSVQPISTTPTTDGKTLSIDTQTGIVTIPALAVKDNSKVTAHHGIFNLDTPDPTDKISGKDIEGQVGDNPATTPTNPPTDQRSGVGFEEKYDGSATALLYKNSPATKAVITFTATDGTPKTIEFTRATTSDSWTTTQTGDWTLEDGVFVQKDPQTNQKSSLPVTRVAIAAPAIQDYTDVVATAYNAQGTELNSLLFRVVADLKPDTTEPKLVSIVAPTTGDVIELTYNEEMDTTNAQAILNANNTADASKKLFTIQSGGQSITINDIKIVDNKVTLHLSDKLAEGKSLSVSYKDPTPDDNAIALQDTAGNDAFSFSNNQLGVGAYLAKNQEVDLTMIGDVKMVDLGLVRGAHLDKVTLENVKDNYDGLFIKGDAGDTITLGSVLDAGNSTIQADVTGQWTKGDKPTVGSFVEGDDSTYNVWTHTDGIMLYIDADMTVL